MMIPIHENRLQNATAIIGEYHRLRGLSAPAESKVSATVLERTLPVKITKLPYFGAVLLNRVDHILNNLTT